MVTIKDIAKTVGVSASTVSRALSGSPLVNNETKRRILDVARSLGYERNELARALVKGASGAIGLIVPDITNPFFSDIARGVSDIADRASYGVILCNTDGRVDRELSYVRLMRRKRVDGLLVCSATLDAPFVQDLAAAGTPFVLVSRMSADPDVPYVITDDRAGARLAVEHLVDLGHRAITPTSRRPQVGKRGSRSSRWVIARRRSSLPTTSPHSVCLKWPRGLDFASPRTCLSWATTTSATLLSPGSS
jgi:LacI family transcriptional regulator